MTIFIFFIMVALLLGTLAAIVRYSYEVIYQFLVTLDDNIALLIRLIRQTKAWLVMKVIAYRQNRWYKRKLPLLREQSRRGSDLAIAERLAHTKHTRDKYDYEKKPWWERLWGKQ